MKNAFILALFFLSAGTFSQVKNDSIPRSIAIYQFQLNMFYTDSTKTPLSKAEQKEFKGLNFFPTNLDYRVLAKVEKYKKKDTVNFPTSNGMIKRYIRYAKATFTIKGKKYALSLYQRAGIKTKELFLPFTDLTSNAETYGGGRYIDLEIPDGNTMILDFNLCYHPYCAYSHNGWSCPIPPKENFVNTRIEAGVKLTP